MFTLEHSGPLSQAEIEDWLRLLSPTLWGKIKIIGDLLKHANEDEMSSEDHTICVTILRRLFKEAKSVSMSRNGASKQVQGSNDPDSHADPANGLQEQGL